MKETYVLNYRDKLNGFREYTKDSPRNCVDVLRDQIEEARLKLSGIEDSEGEDLGEVLIRTISKDLSRYFDSFSRYQKALSEMGETDTLRDLRKKIILGDKDFFRETWKEPSDNFFKTRKFIYSHLKNLPLSSKIGNSLDCLVSSLRMYTLKKYGS